MKIVVVKTISWFWVCLLALSACQDPESKRTTTVANNAILYSEIEPSKYTVGLSYIPECSINADTLFFYQDTQIVKVDLIGGKTYIDRSAFVPLQNAGEYLPDWVRNIEVTDDRYLFAMRQGSHYQMDRKTNKVTRAITATAWEQEANRAYYAYLVEGLDTSSVVTDEGNLADIVDVDVYRSFTNIPNHYIKWTKDILEITNDNGRAVLTTHSSLPRYSQLKYPDILWATDEIFIVNSLDKRGLVYKVDRNTRAIVDSVDLSSILKQNSPDDGGAVGFTLRHSNNHYYAVYLEKGALQVVRFDL